MKAGQEIDPSETREWYLGRCSDVGRFKVGKCDKPIKVNGSKVHEHSECALVKGFPFFVYRTPSTNGNENQYHIESPVAKEHLGLPYKVIVKLQIDQEYVHVNTYHNGIVDRVPVRRNGQLWNDWMSVKVQLE